jgi:hypothetical protein
LQGKFVAGAADFGSVLLDGWSNMTMLVVFTTYKIEWSNFMCDPPLPNGQSSSFLPLLASAAALGFVV